ncbi:MAG: M16 family metallopeptidase [Desulfobaccales bacterium]
MVPPRPGAGATATALGRAGLGQGLMKKILVVLLCLALAAAALAAPESAAPQQVLGVRQELPNGLVWLFSEQRSLPLVSVNLLIKGGVLRDPPGKAGLANLTALLLVQGTKKRSATQIAQDADFIGAKLRASGSDDYVSVSLTVLKKDLETGLSLLQDIVFNPVFAKEEIKRKVAQLKASFQTNEDEPGIVASRAFHRRLFGNHPYAHPPKGTPEGLAAIEQKDVVDFHQKFFRPNNTILTIVGDLSLEEARGWVEKTFGDWKAAPLPELRVPPPAGLKSMEKIMIDKKITQANIILGHLGISRRHPDFYPLQLLNYILGGGGFSSRLMDRIREQQGLAYSVGSSFDAGLEPGAIAIDLETKNQSAGEAVAQVLREIERLRTQKVSKEEFEEAKSYLIGSFPAKMDSVAKRAALMAYVEFYGLGLDYPWRYPALIRNFTPDDLQKVAQKYLHPDKYLLVVVGNQSELQGMAGAASPPSEKESTYGKNYKPRP